MRKAKLSKLALATHETALAPALTAVQQAIDDWVGSIERDLAATARKFPDYWPPPGEELVTLGCDVTRNDGALLSIACDGSDVAPRPNIYERVFSYRRTAEGLVPLSHRELFPKAQEDLFAELMPLCERAGAQLVRPEEVSDLPHVLKLFADTLYTTPLTGDRGFHGICTLPYPALAPLTGCGALGALARPRSPPRQLVQEGKVGPLAMALQRDDWPRFLRAHVDDAAVVTALNRDIQAWVDEQRAQPAPENERHHRCTVTMSSARLVSVLCERGAHWTQVVDAASFTYRVQKRPTRVTPQELFAARPGATRQITRRCLTEYLKEHSLPLDQLPSLKPEPIRYFGLGERSVTFILRLPWTAQDGSTRRVQHRCEVPYRTLSTSPALLGKP